MSDDSNKNVKEVLEQRGSRYGTILDNAVITDKLMTNIKAKKDYANFLDNLSSLGGNEKVPEFCLFHICNKISRACYYKEYMDNYVDICGYYKLLQGYCSDRMAANPNSKIALNPPLDMFKIYENANVNVALGYYGQSPLFEVKGIDNDIAKRF